MGSRNLLLNVLLVVTWGWLVFVLFLRDILKGKRGFRRVLAFVGGIVGLFAGVVGLATLLPKAMYEANPIIEGLVVPVNGNPIPTVLLLIALAFFLILGLLAGACRLVYFGITGRHIGRSLEVGKTD